MQIEPRYTPDNCSSAYQLNCTLSVFGRESLPSPDNTIQELRSALAGDHLKILEFKHKLSNIVQFFLSSRPNSNPSDIVRLIKGRWQYVMRPIKPIEFRRNYRSPRSDPPKQKCWTHTSSGNLISILWPTIASKNSLNRFNSMTRKLT